MGRNMLEISAEKLTLGYGTHTVVRDVSFTLAPGRITGLVGPNGSGKSTLIKALSRTLSPRAGRVRLNGRDVRDIPRLELARLVGVVPQIPLLPSSFTAFEVVLMGRNPHLGFFQYEGARDKAIALRAMAETRTRLLAQRRIGELSGGEIQSVVIARVRAQETSAVLLDEPTANLDIGRQVEVLDLMQGLSRTQGLTVGIALHDLNLAIQYCDCLLLLDGGRIIAAGPPAEVVTAENIRAVYGAANCVYEVQGRPAVLPRAGTSPYGGQA
jgi:iron complex transport system ATP-binding protein